MGSSIRKGILGMAVAASLVGAVGVVSAHAASPWWHLSSASRPTYLQPGQRKNEVQLVTVSATGGEFFLIEPLSRATEETKFVRLAFDATASEVQVGLEGLYGAGNVEVAKGQGNAAGDDPYEVIFKGMLADRPVETMETLGGLLEGGRAESTVGEVVKGHADGQILVTAGNLGDGAANAEAHPISIVDRLPAGLEAVAIEGEADEELFRTTGNDDPLECSLGSLTCTFSGKSGPQKMVMPYEQIQMRIAVNLKAGAKSGEVNEASIAGGEARPVTATQALVVSDTPAPFGVVTYEMRPEEEGGSVDTQAGSHPFQLTTTIMFNETLDGKPLALAKDLHFKLPAGLIGNPAPIPHCSLAKFLAFQCAAQTQLGVAKVIINVKFGKNKISPWLLPVYNLEPAVGEPARFGFVVFSTPVILDTAVRTGGDYGVTVNVTNISQEAEFLGSEVTFWGSPEDPSHDNARGNGAGQPNNACLGVEPGSTFYSECHFLESKESPPFLALPTSCSGPLQTTVEADSWREPANVNSFGNTDLMPALDGCNRLQFNPSISVAPDGQAGSTPSGLAVAVHVPQDVSLNPKGLVEADVKDTTVALPNGVTLNPAAADGLSACSEAQVSLSTQGASACPESSKVGVVKIKTPLLPNELEGAAYLAAQDANPFGSLVALYVVAQDPVSGTSVKLAGEVVPDPVTGQLVSTFKNTPQLPFETFELHFFGGDRAPLSTPALCGAYTTTASIEPWTGSGQVDSSSTFNIVSAPNGSPCHSPLPFNPALTAGTTSIQAGGFSPFTMTMSRPDGSQNLQAIQLKMPPGLLGTLASVKLCPEAQANAGTCGPESLIGHTTVSVGVGGDPYSVTGGQVFITEGYKGAPYGLSIVNPAKAGPFDLGHVIVRAKIEVDPISAVLTITTDTTGPYKIPTILDGIPLQIQHVNVAIDRPGFTFNPTNCSPLAITGSLTSDQGATKDLSVPFQITNCAVLAFKPKLTAKTSGKTSRKAGASLSVKLTYPAGPYDANISKVKVDLPKQLPSRLTTLQQACPAKTFEANPAACPSASIVGHAKASTPVLPTSLEGPAYFVSHGGEEFPQLIIVLQGYGTTVHLVGSTFISKAGITSSTFKQVPDVPVGTFELILPQGKFSALAANGNLCTAKKLAMPTLFIAQNGATIHTSTPIVPTGCAKHATHKAKHKAKHKRKK
jgi:hypothetical protein